ncbi:MAG: type IV pilus biogenesis/stability protein PilW [Gammaproteobacteria bacterium]|nr:type IV pilus biogenesis/stability protein PilW [Gammaproteobacteria bacterium]
MLALLVALSACSSGEKKPDKPEIKETPAKINAELGRGYMQQGDYRLAMEKLETALSYNPQHDKAHHYMAQLNRLLGDSEGAIKHYQLAIELAPDNSQLRNNYGAYLCEQKKYKEAEVHFLLAINDPLFEGKLQAYENIGLCAYEAGDLEKAEKYLRKALRINPKLPYSLIQMAMIHFDNGEYLRARAFLQRYEEVGPVTAASLWLGVQVEHQLGDRKTMQRYATELSRNFPDTEQWRAYTRQRW